MGTTMTTDKSMTSPGAVGHTKGPWEAQEPDTGKEPGIGIIAANLGGMVAWVGYTGANFRKPETAKANARLIAAAPRMYDRIAKLAVDGDAEAIEIMEAINGKP